jgi:hypothetical protein
MGMGGYGPGGGGFVDCFGAISRRLSSRKTNIYIINPVNGELNPICHLLALLGAHHILHVSRVRVKKS